ncbi:MAG: hypothetical protein MK089_00100 [Phycisphaerales bacterium]|nr:hypothetical protein [Phycisphaerales bacterium]
MKPDEASAFLTDSVELDIHDDDQLSIEQRIRDVTGQLKQAGGARTSDGASPASVYVRLFRPEGVVRLQTNLKVIFRRDLIDQLAVTLGGENRIRINAMSPTAVLPPRKRRYGKR